MSCSIRTVGRGAAGAGAYIAKPYRDFAKELTVAVALLLLAIALLSLAVFVFLLAAGSMGYLVGVFEAIAHTIQHTPWPAVNAVGLYVTSYLPAVALMTFIVSLTALACWLGHRELNQNKQTRIS